MSGAIEKKENMLFVISFSKLLHIIALSYRFPAQFMLSLNTKKAELYVPQSTTQTSEYFNKTRGHCVPQIQGGIHST